MSAKCGHFVQASMCWFCVAVIHNLTNPTMHLSHIPQYTIQNRNVHISVLNGVLWDMGQVHYEIYKTSLFHYLLGAKWDDN